MLLAVNIFIYLKNKKTKVYYQWYYSVFAVDALSTKDSGLAQITARWSSLVARWAHNPKVVGSNPALATNKKIPDQKWSGIFFAPVV